MEPNAGSGYTHRSTTFGFKNAKPTIPGFYYLGNIMIEALKSDDIVNKVGGRFKLTALIQRRLAEIIDGARPLVERDGRSDLELVIEEIRQDKITVGWKDEDDDAS